MYIGELASLTGATPKAIRHYEKLGLLPVAKEKAIIVFMKRLMSNQLR